MDRELGLVGGWDRDCDHRRRDDDDSRRRRRSRRRRSHTADGRTATRQAEKGKLRILYEGFPMALITEQAGGVASTGLFQGKVQRILEVLLLFFCRMPFCVAACGGWRTMAGACGGGDPRGAEEGFLASERRIPHHSTPRRLRPTPTAAASSSLCLLLLR